MSRMLDLVRANALPWHQMMTASKGALHLPAEEMVEILVYLTDHNKIMGEQARLTLAGWDEASAKVIVANPKSSPEVLAYWLLPQNLRPPLFPLLLENPSVGMTKLSDLATQLKGEWIDLMISSPRVRASQELLTDLSSNKHLSGTQSARVQELITGKPAVVEVEASPVPDVASPSPTVPASAELKVEVPPGTAEPAAEPKGVTPPAVREDEDDAEADEALVAFFAEHASELAAEAEKPFQAIGGIHEEMYAEPEPKSSAAAAAVGTVPSPSPSPTKAAVKPILPKQFVNPNDEKRGSVLQKITALDIKGRIQLAMKGTKEERAILVRDGTKLVAIAVLDSPKISDGEVEKIASQKNVLEAVLRAIPLRRRFMKNYAVVRNLVFNPRTPIDISMGLMKNLLIADLRNLSGNKEVSDTIRKMALRSFKQKTEAANKD